MGDTCYIHENYVVASIMKTKLKHFDENFVTRKELNYIINLLQKKYNEKNISVIIGSTRDISSCWIQAGNVIVAKNSISDIEAQYTAYLPIQVLTILWDEGFMLKHIIDFKNDELVKAKTNLEKLSRKDI